MWKQFLIYILSLALCTSATYGSPRKGKGKRRSSSPPAQQLVVRLAVDVGAINTTIKIAKIDPAKATINQVLYESTTQIGVREGVIRSGTGVLPSEIQDKIIGLLKLALEEAKELDVTEYALVSTSALGGATNSDAVIKRIVEATGLDLKVIDRKTEASLAFVAAAAGTSHSPKSLIVWDLGGGSQEIITLGRGGQPEVYISEVGSLAFAARVIRDIKRENPIVVTSPNPLTHKEIDKAIGMAKELAKEVPDTIRARIIAPNTVVVGIGGLARLEADTVRKTYTISDLEKSIDNKAGLSENSSRGSALSPHSVTNLALAIGYMEELSISQISTYSITLAEGLLVAPALQSKLPQK